MSQDNNFTPARNQILQRAKSPDNLIFPINEVTHGILFLFRDYTYQPTGARGFSQLSSRDVTDSIFLPLPSNLSDNFEIRVQPYQQGGGGELASTLLSELNINDMTPGSLIGGISGGAAKAIPANTLSQIGGGNRDLNSIIKSVSADMAFALRKGIDGVLPSQGRNIDLGTGTLINPKAALAFEGVEMKSHSFDWTLSPKSETESAVLRKIIQTIKRKCLPSYADTGVLQKSLFKYPSTVDSFLVGADPEFYYYFKTSMIRTFNVNYTPNGVSVLKGGKPATVQMQMNLIETDIHTSEDYDGGNINSSGSS